MADPYQAVVLSEYGDPDVLGVVELDAPPPSPGQVRIAVRAAGVNPIDWKIRSGAMAGVIPVEFPVIPGVDVALDASGRGSLPDLIDLTGGPGRVVTIADHSAGALGVRATFGGPTRCPAASPRRWRW